MNHLIRVTYNRKFQLNQTLVENCSNGRDTSDVFDMPKVLTEIQKAKASELLLENLKILGKELLSDLPNYEQVSTKVLVALKEVQSERQRTIESWVMEFLTKLTISHYVIPFNVV